MEIPIEVDARHIPPADGIGEVVPSRPLHELALDAPYYYYSPTSIDALSIRYPFSNDESAPYFTQMTARRETADYLSATNRTALLVGESALAVALPYITEETILLVDSNTEMSAYMKGYVTALREADTVEEWHDRMDTQMFANLPESVQPTIQGEVTRAFTRQFGQWDAIGVPHPLVDPDAYKQVHELALQKAFIPWNANLTRASEVRELADALRAYSGTITLMNLSNVLDHVAMYSPHDHLEIEQLPIAEQAPILTTSSNALPAWIIARDCHASDTEKYLATATGPFFGVAELAKAGGLSLPTDRMGAYLPPYKTRPAIRRHYMSPAEYAGELDELAS